MADTEEALVSVPPVPQTHREPGNGALFPRSTSIGLPLTPAILLSMVIGVLLGVHVPNTPKVFDLIQFHHVSIHASVPHFMHSINSLLALTISIEVAVEMIIMMRPALCKI
ncbi:hypothetical protein DL96DRAFT_1829371 [Flagelloscypha sp. PMI_526]|nr:hypothetical protein DL96DRAFT_1829371 [Flagelloscypha sp. PMI_526]